MRKSGAITLALLGGLLLTGCLCGGCGQPPRHRPLYDRQRNPVPRERWIGPDGQPAELYDEAGNLVPADRVRAAYNQPASYSSSSRWNPGPGFFYWGSPWSSGRSWGGSSYSPGSSSRSAPSNPGSVSRGGFGGTGHGLTGGGS